MTPIAGYVAYYCQARMLYEVIYTPTDVSCNVRTARLAAQQDLNFYYVPASCFTRMSVSSCLRQLTRLTKYEEDIL